jgi:hypothetical protein
MMSMDRPDGTSAAAGQQSVDGEGLEAPSRRRCRSAKNAAAAANPSAVPPRVGIAKATARRCFPAWSTDRQRRDMATAATDEKKAARAASRSPSRWVPNPRAPYSHAVQALTGS